MDLYLLSVIIFFSILGIIIYRDRKNIDFKYILLMRRTKRFRKTIDRIAQKSPRFWKVVGTFAVLFCLFFMINGIYNMLNIAYLIYLGIITRPAVQFALPIPSEQMYVGPGFIGIPFWFWIITVATILVPHEAFHGIIARAEKIKLKDVGLLLLLIFPGAFVEPDEKQVEKSKLMTKLRIFSAGSFINIFLGIIIVLLVQNLIWTSSFDGLLITNVNETSPAGYLGLEPGMVLENIDGKELSLRFDEYSFLILMVQGSNTEKITYYMSNIILSERLKVYKPGDMVTLKVDGKDYEIELGEHPDFEGFPYIGINSRANIRDINLFLFLFPLLGMIVSLNIVVGIFNILPIYPLDGGLIIKAITEKYAKKRSNRITMAITYFMILLLIYSFAGGYIKF